MSSVSLLYVVVWYGSYGCHLSSRLCACDFLVGIFSSSFLYTYLL